LHESTDITDTGQAFKRNSLRLLWQATLNNVTADVFKEFGFKLLLAFSRIFNYPSAEIVKYSSEFHLIN